MNLFFLTDLTPDEQQLLIDIRRKKAQLLHEIQVRNTFFIVIIDASLMYDFNQASGGKMSSCNAGEK